MPGGGTTHRGAALQLWHLAGSCGLAGWPLAGWPWLALWPFAVDFYYNYLPRALFGRGSGAHLCFLGPRFVTPGGRGVCSFGSCFRHPKIDNTHPRLCGPFGLCGGVPKPTKATFLCYPPTIDAKVVVNPTPMPGARANPKPWSVSLQ